MFATRQFAGRWLIATFAGVVALTSLPANGATPSKAVEFNRDIRPILSENCFHCHGSDANKRKGKLRLDTFEGATQKGAIVPGKPNESTLVARIFNSDLEEVMPPKGSNRHLTEQQKVLLREWIAAGAKYDTHWAFTAPKRPALPKVKQSKWAKNEIDHFILAKLETEKLKPSPRAPTEKLLRRVSLDLTGLPPSPELMAKWLKQPDPFASAVTELLASPHFGERMTSDWMDIARYADTHGFNNDSLRSMWRWRDWVIEAFNRNLPYDQFIAEQLAGDLLPKPTLGQRIATGFNRNHVINSEGGIIGEEYRVEYVADRVRTTSMAWLGLTMECARCHDHKFDPITQKDFFRLFAFFNNVEEYGEDGRLANASPFIASPTRKQQEEMAKHRSEMDASFIEMKSYLSRQAWEGVSFEALGTNVQPSLSIASTNLIAALDLSSWNEAATSISNVAGGKPFAVRGKMSATDGPLDEGALTFSGDTSLKTPGLPRGDGSWGVATWVRRDKSEEGPLFSTMNFGVPPSSQSYGRGIEVRLRGSGAVEVRIARFWPAYSANVVTHETIPVGEWHHVLVTCTGERAKDIRIFLNGEECFRHVLHDDFAESGLSGDALIGGSDEPGAKKFTGALAGLRVFAKPGELEKLAEQARDEAVRGALKTSRSSTLQQAWLRKMNPDFAKAENKWRQARSALQAIERDAPTTMIMEEMSKPRTTHVLFRGQYDQPRDIVEPGVPELLLPFPADAPRNRLGLTKWFVDPRHPLTARVVVNRFWQSIFGTGIVKSVEDFGFQADWPSHPELLDWLAVEFVESGWDVKKLLRWMVTSATYQQDSDSKPEINERDPENRLLARGPRQRLTAEMLRDQALAIGGLLHNEIGGPPAYPYQPTNLYQGIVVAAPYPGTSYTDGTGADLYRRSLYTFWKRTVPHPTLATFDAPDREVCVARRLKTNTPLQALALMNDTIQLESSRKLAERMLMEGGKSPADRIQFAFTLATARKPDAKEKKALASLLEKRLAYYKTAPDAAKSFVSVGASKPSESLDVAELAAYANVASLILNLDETITRN
jgi:hypothetical protein